MTSKEKKNSCLWRDWGPHMYPSPPTLHRLLMQPAFLRLGIRSLNIYTSVMGKEGKEEG